MGFWSRLVNNAKAISSGFEVNKPDKSDVKNINTFLDTSATAINNLLSNIRTLNVARELLFVEYDVMAAETRCAKALEMYADLATQRDATHGKIFSVICDDPTLKQDIESFLERMEIDNVAWDIAYDLCKFGNVFFKVYANKDLTDVESIMQVDDPSTVCELSYLGKTQYYIESVNRANGWITAGNLLNKNSYNIYDINGFIHFKIHSTKRKDTIDLEDLNYKDENGNPTIRTFKIMDGESIVEKARLPFRMLQPMEDSLVANTVAKADFVKLANVEVGNASDRDTEIIVNKVKGKLDAGVTMDTQTGQYSAYKHYRGYGDWIVNAVHGGINSIDIKPIGGDINVKDLAQMDYVEGLYYVGLGIPKALMGREECFRYNTKVTLLDGRTLDIGYMAEHQEDFVGKGILSCNPDGQIVPTTISHVKKTRLNANFLRVWLDNGEYVDVTPDHKMMMRDGSFKEAQCLQINDSLMPLYSWYENGRKVIRNNIIHKYDHKKQGLKLLQYRLVAKCLLNEGIDIPKGYCVHHKDHAKHNDDPSNLQIMTVLEHASYHGKSELSHQRGNETRIKNGKPSYVRTEETKQKISYWASQRTWTHWKSGKDNILHNPEIYERYRQGVRRFFDNGGTVWNKNLKERDIDRYNKWQEAVNGKKAKEKQISTIKATWDKKREQKRIDFESSRKEYTLICDYCGQTYKKWMTDEEYQDYINMNSMSYCTTKCAERNGNYAKAFHLWENLPIKNKEEYNKNRLKFTTLYDTFKKQFNTIKENRQMYNHKVVKIEKLDVIEDAYDLGVASENHTFALAAGIFVHNSIKGGLGAEGTFAQLDKEFLRRVTKVSDALCYGIEDLVNVWLRLRDHNADPDVVPLHKFKIMYNNPSTDDAYQKLKELKSRLDMASQITQTISSVDSRVDTIETLKKMCNLFVPFPEFNESLNNILKDAEKTGEENTSKGIQPQVGTGEGGIGGGSRGGAINLGGNSSRGGNTPSPATRPNTGTTSLPRPSQSGGITNNAPTSAPNTPTEI